MYPSATQLETRELDLPEHPLLSSHIRDAQAQSARALREARDAPRHRLKRRSSVMFRGAVGRSFRSAPTDVQA
jgi:hypothetical protein